MPIISPGLKSVIGLAPVIGGNSVTSISNTCRAIVSGAVLVMLAWPVFADDRSTLERQVDSAIAMMLGEESNPLDISVQFGRTAAKAGKRRIVDTSIRIPIAPLTMVPVGGDTYQGQLEFTFYLEDEEGASTPIQQSELPLELPGEAVSSPTPIHITYDVGFKVRPGHHRLALTVADMLGSTSSSLTWYVSVDEQGAVIVADR